MNAPIDFRARFGFHSAPFTREITLSSALRSIPLTKPSQLCSGPSNSAPLPPWWRRRARARLRFYALWSASCRKPASPSTTSK